MITPSSRSIAKQQALEKDPFVDVLAVGPTGLEELLGPSLKEFLPPRSASSEAAAYVPRKVSLKHIAKIQMKKQKASKISSSAARMRTAAQRGMRNPGTLCYQISLLQALFHQPKLVNFLAESHTAEDCVCDPEKSCLACALRIMSRGYWETPIDNPFYPKLFANSNRLFKSLGWASDIRNGHADPDEQIAWIFCEMRKVLATSPYSSLESITQMITTSSIRCHCGHESRTAGHPDRTLPISINPRIPGGTLAQYVKRYMVEAIEGYRCGACSESKRTKHRRNIVEHAPEILTLQLKRFNYDGRKITTDIPIGTSLDLGPYRDNGNEESMKYELSAVIKHAGSLTMGHYICSAKGPDGAWYSFDDSVVSKDSLRTATGLGGGFTPYLLFFQRQEA